MSRATTRINRRYVTSRAAKLSLCAAKGEEGVFYANEDLLAAHFGAAANESRPLIRLAAAVIRGAAADMRDGDSAFRELLVMRATPYPDSDAERRTRVDHLTSLLERIEEAHASVLWFNEGEALMPFSRVCYEIEIGCKTARLAIAKTMRMQTDGPDFLLVSRWSLS